MRFSEIQFSFGIMHELVNCKYKSSRGWVAPYFPSQWLEGKLGYDVCIHSPVRTVFFQFKVPEKRTSSRAAYWSCYYKPYYTIKIRPDSVSHQHNNLVDWARNPHNRVYYCAPRFSESNEFFEHFRLGNIYRNSIYVPCSTLRRISGSDKHEITYTDVAGDGYRMHSKESIIKAFSGDEFMEDVMEAEAYDNIYDCLNSIQAMFGLPCDIGNDQPNNSIEKQIEKYYMLSSKLHSSKGLILMLFLG